MEHNFGVCLFRTTQSMCTALKTTMSKNLKVIELIGTRDLVGRFLYLSTLHDIYIYIWILFSYHLTPAPLSLAHIEGNINKTDKAKLLHKIEGMVENIYPNDRIYITIVDAMFFSHVLLNVPATFGEIARVILSKLYDLYVRVDLACDTYHTPSVKDVEHTRRGEVEEIYIITGPQQKRSRYWQRASRSSSMIIQKRSLISLGWVDPACRHWNYVWSHNILCSRGRMLLLHCSWWTGNPRRSAHACMLSWRGGKQNDVPFTSHSGCQQWWIYFH